MFFSRKTMLALRKKLFSRRTFQSRLREILARNRFRPYFESLEERRVLANYVVSNTGDAGAGSLRQAIVDANTSGGADTIQFNIGGGGVQTISPLSPLPFLSDLVTIDGYSQPGSSANNLSIGDNAAIQIQIDGSLAGASIVGLGFAPGASGGSSIRGLAINRFSAYQISVAADNIIIAGNFIGTNASGTAVLSGGQGIRVGGSGSVIGGAAVADRNLVSMGGGSNDGVVLGSDTNTTVRNNYIGTTASGTSSLGNRAGVSLASSSLSVIRENVIAGGTEAGIYIDNNSTSLILGNLIGTDANGTSALPNDYGVEVILGSAAAVGDGTIAGRNIVSGNTNDGVYTSGNGTTIRGNYIGTKADGLSTLGNGRFGVNLSSVGSTLGGLTGTPGVPAPGTGNGNVISGNGFDGVFAGANNTILGNIIGLDKNGDAILANARYGILLTGPSNNIGNADVRGRNIIAGNNQEGIFLTNSSCDLNVIRNNYIGTDIGGTLDRGNVGDGIFIATGADTNSIVENVVSGNNATGILVEGNSNKIQNNKIGTNAAGNADLGNTLSGVWIYAGSGNFVGVDGDNSGDSSESNLISGNDSFGVYFQGDSNNNIVAGNFIGTNATGTAAIGNSSGGIIFLNDLLGDNNRIGTNADGTSDLLERNIISGNLNYGIVDFGVGTTIAGNYVGTKADGLSALANAQGGVSLGSSGATVGGTATAARNVISGNDGFGVSISTSFGTGNTVLGNYIGVDANGTAAVANTSSGVQINGGATNNTIGGSTAASRNVISGNTLDGISVEGAGTTNNTIAGNYIGVDVTGNTKRANGGSGVILVTSGVTSNIIGGLTGTVGNPQPGAGPGNVISGNSGYQIFLAAHGQTVQGNMIGLGADGSTVIDVATAGIGDGSVNNSLIGGLDVRARNVISGLAVSLNLSSGSGTRILNNYIGTDVTGSQGRGSGPSYLYGASNLTIGAAGAGNVWSASSSYPISGFGSDWTIQGNRFGTTADGSAPLLNTYFWNLYSLTNFVLGGTGVGEGNQIADQINIADSTGGTVQGNSFGLNAAGTAVLAGSAAELSLYRSSGFIVGGSAASARNVFASVGFSGVDINGFGADGNIIRGNYFGTNAAGTSTLGSFQSSIYVSGSAANNTIDGNVIASGSTAGVYIDGGNSSRINDIPNFAAAWFKADGSLANSAGYSQGGTSVGPIAFGPGVAGGQAFQFNRSTPGYVKSEHIASYTLDGNNVSVESWINPATLPSVGQEYYIGSNGDASNPNYAALLINTGGSTQLAFRYRTSTGSQTATSPAVSFGTGSFHHIAVTANGTNVKFYVDGSLFSTVAVVGSPQTFNNFVAGDPSITLYIGGSIGATNRTFDGKIDELAVYNRALTAAEVSRIFSIGGADKGGNWTRNTIVTGNIIGLLADGTTAGAISGDGIKIDNSESNTIGGTTAAARNIISNAGSNGVNLSSTYARFNLIAGNYIGTDLSGLVARGNTYGVSIASGATNNTIGGTVLGSRNVISGNIASAVVISGTTTIGNVLLGNYVGLGADGSTSLGNEGFSVFVNGAPNNTIGGLAPGEGNVISATTNLVVSTGAGIVLYPGADNTRILGNRIGTDATGNLARPNHYGIVILSGVSATEIRGNQISANEIGGVDLQAPNSVIAGNLFGTNATGTASLGNGQFGLLVNAINVRIGGIVAADRNIISGHSQGGIEIVNTSTGVLVQGNYIGTNVTGTAAIANGTGVGIDSGAQGNTVGGPTSSYGNVISGNLYGVSIANSDGNTIAANIIGLDKDGLGSLPNTIDGIALGSTSNNTTIGGISPSMDSANFISSNGRYGIAITTSAGTTGNNVIGNVIGLNKGDQPRSNGLAGIIINGSSDITIGGTVAGSKNVISGNDTNADGIWLNAASNNTIQGNYIGTDSTGQFDLGNAVGIVIAAGSINNTIGGATTSARNLISGNDLAGVEIYDASTSNNTIAGNYIGTDKTGMASIANGLGVRIEFGATNNTIGGVTNATRNVISGNTNQGIILKSGPGNRVIGNYIGTNAVGFAALANSTGVDIGGASNIVGTDGDGVNDAAERNVISGNTQYGVDMNGATNNKIAGNYIGTNAAGTTLIPNAFSDVATFFSTGNIIGTDGSNDPFNANERNVIGGNVILQNANGFAGNYVGINATGTAALSANPKLGVQVSGTTGSRVGTNGDGIADVEERNVISGINGPAILVSQIGAIIAGNYIGTDPAGFFAIPNQRGVDLGSSVTGVRIGTNADGVNDAAERNIISGNTGDGVLLSGIGTTGNTIVGNYIGTNATGTGAIGNNVGVTIRTGATGNRVGGSTTGERNVISGNIVGVTLTDSGTNGNRVSGNYIGTDWTGSLALANGSFGVLLYSGASSNIIGTNGDGTNDVTEGNVISGNAYGVFIQTNANTNVIAGNFIGTNAAGTGVIRNVIEGVRIFDNSITGTRIGTNADGVSDVFERNVISGNTNTGINVGSGVGTVIGGNYIGTDVTGSLALGNNTGILLAAAAINNTVGGTSVASRNVISGNTQNGVQIDGVGTSNNFVLGNYIGINASGNGTLANATGIAVLSGASGNTIGTSEFGQRIIATDTASTPSGFTASFGIRVASNGDIYAAISEGLAGGGIYRYDPGSGTRTLVSAGRLTVGPLDQPIDLAFESPTSLVVTSISTGSITKALVRVNTTTGAQTLVSDLTNPAQGPVLTYASGVVVEASGNFIVANSTTNGLYRIDRITGNRTLISSGGLLVSPYGLALEANGQLITTNAGGNSLVRVNPTTGAQSVVAGGFDYLLFVAVAADGSIYVTDGATTPSISTPSRVYRVDPISGTKTIVATALTGDSYYNGIAIDPNGSLVVNDIPDPLHTISNIVRLTQGGARNVFGGNSVNGILIDGANSNSVLQNDIGLNGVGIAAPNAFGVRVTNNATSNVFSGNNVRFSTSDNIFIESAGNVLSRNVTAEMGGLPIRLNPSSLSPGLVTITQVVSGANPLVLGEVQARQNTTYTVELFTSTTLGQASRYVTSTPVTTDASGFATFSISSPAGQMNGFVHATLTGLGTSGAISTSQLSNGILATPAIILGLRSQSPEGTPITLTAFASSNPVTGYLWEVKKDGLAYAFELRTDGTQSDGGIQFTPDDEGVFTVSLRVTLADGTQSQLGPFAINVYNVAPTPSFSYAPSVISAGTVVTLTSNNSDPGQLDVLKNSWEVRSGSPTGPIVYSAPLSIATSTSFTPAAGGFFYATMTVDDGDGGVRTLTREIAVNGLPASTTIVVPDTSVREGQAVRARAPEAELNRTEQLTFVWTIIKTPAVGPSVDYILTAPSLVTEPSRGVLEFVPNDDGVYTIGLTISAGASSVFAAPQQVVVANVSPRIQITGAPNSPAVGTPINLGSSITDPGIADTHTVTWSVMRDNQPFGTTTVGSSFSFTPNVAGVYSVTATATDDDGGVGTTRRAFNLSVAKTPATPLTPTTPAVPPVPPTPRVPDVPLVLPGYVAVTILPPNGPYYENTSYTFGATVPAGVVSYIWRARSAAGLLVSGINPTFSFTPQQGGDHLVELSVTLSDGRVGTAFFSPMSVLGAAPVVSPIGVVDPTTSLIYVSTPTIYEGTPVTVRALAIDSREVVGLNYQWELKKPGETSFTIISGVDGAPADFRFLPTDNGQYVVRVSVSDSQGLTTQQSLTVSITNADPLVRLESIFNTAANVRFRAIASDPGIDDTPDLRYAWSINGGAFSTPSTVNEFEPSLSGLTQLSVRVTDGDGGVATRSFFVLQGTNNADTFTITASNTTGAGIDDQILYLALDGNDDITIDASVTKKVVVLGGKGDDIINASAATVAVLLDGGDDNDTLTGGSTDDVLIAGPGINALRGGNGNNRFVGGGSDTMIGGVNSDYYEVHFSTVVLEDLGGIDTIDLAGAQAGVQLNLSNNTGAAQTVFTGSTLALNGLFEKLIGSPYGDDLTTNTAGTEIDGGQGNDRLVSGASGTKLSGGDGNDTFFLDNAAGSFDGGTGNDSVSGTLLNASPTSIATGAGDDVVNVQGATTGALSNVSISLGGGLNSLTASRVSGKIYGNNGASGAIDVFGSASPATSIVTVSNSNDIDIFGSASLGSSITVTSGVNIDIFGSGALSLTGVTGGRITSSIFGSASTAPMVATVSSSTYIDIFGSASPTGPGLTATVSGGSSNIDIFGSASPGVSTVTVTGGSSNIDIFGSASPTGSALNATVSSSSSIDIFGSASTSLSTVTVNGGSNNIDIFGSASTGTMTVTVAGSNDIGIFGSASPTAGGLNATISGSTNVDIFGSASTGVSTIVVDGGSSNIDIFGSASPTGSNLNATISNSSIVDIFGSASTGVTMVTVNGGSSDIDIFGSASPSGSGLTATISNSSNVDIFGSASTTGATTVTVSGGSTDIDIFGSASPISGNLNATISGSSIVDIFGSASTTGVTTVTVSGGSTDIDIFGSASPASGSLTATISNSSNVDIFGSASPTGGDLTATISSSSNVDIFGSASTNGVTTVTVNDGSSYIDIFGSASTTGSSLSATISGSNNVDIFGSASTTGVTTVTVNGGSHDIDIFGSASPNGSSLNATISGSNNVDIFGSASISGVTTVTVNGGSNNIDIFGSASPTGSGLTATISGSTNVDIFGSASTTGATSVTVNGGSNNIDIFGSASPLGSSLTATISGSTNVDIFGSASASVSTVTVSNSSNIDIFGSASPNGSGLDVTISSSSNVDIFGSASSTGSALGVTISNSSNIDIFGSASATLTTVIVSSSNDIDIFGSASPTGSSLDVTISGSSNIDIFGSASITGVTTVTVNGGSSNIDIFGSASPNGSALNATISNSTNIDIFGSASTGVSSIAVTSSNDIDIFGSASPGTFMVTVASSTDIDIFGSASPTGSTLNATVSNSSNIDIFGSANPAGPGTITVSSSQDIDIFGSASTGTTIVVSSSSDIDIYGGYGDNVTLDNATRTRVEGGFFGSASVQGITVTVTGGSTDIGIFGTSLQDSVTVGPSSRVGVNLRGGADTVQVDGAQHFVALTDSGADRVTIRSGFDMLIYLGTEDDQAEVLGGDLIRIIGEAGNDEFLLSGGSSLTVDGGEGNDRLFVTGGRAMTIRGDAGDDVVDIYGGIGISAVGGVGNEQLRIFGSLGGALDAGKVYALLDGQDGNDVLEVRPLLSVADRGPIPILPIPSIEVPFLFAPAWMTLPLWITAPTVTTFASSIALVGGSGSNSIWLEGAQRLYGIGGDDVDTITLQAGSSSEVAGGRGADIITVRASGYDNRVFGDQDNDIINAYAGTRLGIFGEEGVDTISFDGGQDGFARGGSADDIMEIRNGNRIVLAGEDGNDTATIRGGVSGVAAGGIGNDTLEIVGGSLGLLLGQSGNDHLIASGGTQSIVSGGDGDDQIDASNRGDDLYGDDGDDVYRILITSSSGQRIRLRELLYVDPADFEPQARGSDTIDLSAFSTSANLNLETLGVFNDLNVGVQSVIGAQLQLILLGSLENIIGTSANDTLIGNSESNRIEGRGGNDIISGLGGDDTLEGGTGNDLIDGGSGDDLFLFATDSGMPLGSDTVYEANNVGIDGLDFSGMPVGLGTLDLNIASTQSLSGGLLSLTLRQSNSNAAVAEVEEVVGTSFDDTILGNSLDNRIEPKGGNDIVDGRGGSDIYVFTGRNLGSDQVIDAPPGTGRDTLDFVGFDAPVAIDLALTTPQYLGELTLTLGAGDSIENVLGTSFDDIIYGNSRDNALFGAAGVDRLEGRAGNDRLVGDLPAVVLLDFDSAYRADRGDYNYSQAERDAIQTRLTAAYSAFNWTFTQYESVVPPTALPGSQAARALTDDMGRSFVRIAFSEGRGGGISGDAGEVDFRNTRRRLVTEVNINPLLPTVRQLLTEQVGVNYTPEQYSDMVVAFTSTVAGHELGHTAGLRHGDALGPIGSGYFAETDTTNVYPADTRAKLAVETDWHLLASPASVGTPLSSAARTTFFGEREAIKMAFNDIGRTRREAANAPGSHSSRPTAEDLGSLAKLVVPNLAPSTGYVRSGQSFDVSAMAVVGDLKLLTNTATTEVDYYRFEGIANEVVNIELLASSIRPLRGEAFDGELRIFKSDGTILAFNDDDFEGTRDATLLDVVLPQDGTYYISVGLSEQPAIASPGGRYELFVSRFRVGTSGPAIGDTFVGGAGSDSLTGSAANDTFLASDAQVEDVDAIDGKGGYDTLNTLGLFYRYTSISIENIVAPANTPPVARASSVTTNEDTAKPFVLANFGFVDLENNIPTSITISGLALASGDTLKLSGSNVSVNQLISVANIPNLVYTPALNSNGNARSSFSFKVNDADLGTVAAVMTIHVTAVNDAPSATFNIPTTSILVGTSFSVSLTNPVDPDTASGFTYAFDVGGGYGAFGSANSVGLVRSVVGPIIVRAKINDTQGGITEYTGTVNIVLATGSAYILSLFASGAVTASGNANVNLPLGLFVDSSSPSAIIASGNARINVGGTVQVVGGTSKSGNAQVTKTGVPASTNDPLSLLTSPGITGLTNYGAVSVAGSTTRTLSPGIYTSIQLSGNANVSMSPGMYIIKGGGFTVSGNAGVSGSGVTIFNAGSNYSGTTDGGNFGGIALSGNGNLNLNPPTTGAYAGILIYQSRANTRALSISGNANVNVHGTIYAANAALTMSGNGQLDDTLIVNTLNISGNIALTQLATGSDSAGDVGGNANTLLAGDLNVYIRSMGGLFNSDMLARIRDAITSIDTLLVPYNVSINEVSDPAMATVIINTSMTSASGTAADGVLGSYDPGSNPVAITFLQGWDWYAGADPVAIGASQYDFQTSVMHELGHALGLGHSSEVYSAMNAMLSTRTAHRVLTVADLNIPSMPEGVEPLTAAGFVREQVRLAQVQQVLLGQSNNSEVGGLLVRDAETSMIDGRFGDQQNSKLPVHSSARLDTLSKQIPSRQPPLGSVQPAIQRKNGNLVRSIHAVREESISATAVDAAMAEFYVTTDKAE